jgi:hypothetical protein
MKSTFKATAFLALALTAGLLAAEPTAANVSEKQQLAVFALGYYGYDIPAEALGSIDAQVMQVFAGMKRFEIIGFTQRFKADDISRFVADLKKLKEENLVLPEKYALGEAFLTEADLNKLVGSFFIVVPVVVDYNTKWVAKDDPKDSQWETKIKTSITFMDVAKGTVMAAPILETSGYDKKDKNKAIQAAIDSIPGSLEYQARVVFPLDSKIVSANLVSVKMRLGANMGIKQGYEFAVIGKEEIDGITDEREVGLVVINKVGSEFSDGTILYSGIPLVKETQLREIPRGGLDLSASARYMIGRVPAITAIGLGAQTSYFSLGTKATVSEGFFAFKPVLALDVPLVVAAIRDLVIVPVCPAIGGEFNLYLRRLQISPFAQVGAAIFAVYDTRNDDWTRSAFTHVIGRAGLGLSYLATRDLKIYAEALGEYWFSLANSPIYGVGGSLGATLKF